MSTQIELVSTFGSIIIDVLDNEFMHEFIDKMKQNNELFNIHSYCDNIPFYRRPWNTAKILEIENLLKDVIVKLNEMGLSFPIQPEEIILANDSATRHLLNRLHRYFTTSNHTSNRWNFNDEQGFEISTESNEMFRELVHKINYAVHVAEEFVTSEHIKNFKSHYREYQIIFDRSKPKVNYIQSTVTGYENREVYYNHIKDEHRQFFSTSTDYDVWLTLAQVHGKNYHVCYFDMDDPREYDIECNQFYSGSIALTDRSIARDPQIQNWLRSYGIDPGPEQCGIPVGNIIQGKDLVSQLNEHSVKTIIFHEV